MIIKSIQKTSYQGMYKIQPDSGPVFYVRKEYLPDFDFDLICQGAEFGEEETDRLLDAGLASVVELKAISYLARSEQCRFGLTRKLIQKKYEKKYIDQALSFLESTGYLSDGRFSRAWLHARALNHYEGRTKILAELQARGITKDIASEAVAEFFTENDENEICKKAYEKFVKKGKEGDKLISALLDAGFSYKMIRGTLELEM